MQGLGRVRMLVPCCHLSWNPKRLLALRWGRCPADSGRASSFPQPVLTLSSHPHTCRWMHAPEAHVGPAQMQSRQRETSAGRKEVRAWLLLMQGWHSSFASPGELGFPGGAQPWAWQLRGYGEKCCSERVFPLHGGKKRFAFDFMPLWVQTVHFLAVEWKKEHKKKKERPGTFRVRAMVTAVASRTPKLTGCL